MNSTSENVFLNNFIYLDNKRVYNPSCLGNIILNISGVGHTLRLSKFGGKGQLVIIVKSADTVQINFGIRNRINKCLCISAVGAYNSLCRGSLIIGDDNLFNGSINLILPNSNGHQLIIGNSNLFADRVEINASSEHCVFDVISGIKTNLEDNVHIGDRVWIGKEVLILNKAVIPSDCVVAARAVVTKKFYGLNLLLAGTPAKVVKRNIFWDIDPNFKPSFKADISNDNFSIDDYKNFEIVYHLLDSNDRCFTYVQQIITNKLGINDNDSNKIFVYDENGLCVSDIKMWGGVKFLGIGSKVFIHKKNFTNPTFKNIRITCYSHCCVILEDFRIVIASLNVRLFDDCFFFLGSGTTVVEARIFITNEKYREVIIGRNCLLAEGLTIRTSDGHPLIDLDSNKCINFSKFGVHIGNHVWIGFGVTLLKDVIIQHDSVIGCMSLLTGKTYYNNSVYAGNPARLLRTNVFWKDDFGLVKE